MPGGRCPCRSTVCAHLGELVAAAVADLERHHPEALPITGDAAAVLTVQDNSGHRAKGARAGLPAVLPAPGQPGFGTGTTLVAQQIALHRGTVTITDRPDGAGAHIEVRLPRFGDTENDTHTHELPLHRDGLSDPAPQVSSGASIAAFAWRRTVVPPRIRLTARLPSPGDMWSVSVLVVGAADLVLQMRQAESLRAHDDSLGARRHGSQCRKRRSKQQSSRSLEQLWNRQYTVKPMVTMPSGPPCSIGYAMQCSMWCPSSGSP